MEILKILFINSNGEFQWAGIAALISLVVAIGSYRNNKKILKQQKELNEKNFKGNIIAKARIDWIQEVRKKSVDFISACHKLLEYIKGDNTNLTNIQKFKSDMESNATLLMLYFGPDKGENKNNDLIVFLIWLISGKLLNKDGYYDKDNIILIEDYIDVLIDFLRIYFKAEWKRANREISDKDIQKYLEADKYYIKIVSILKDGIDCHEEWRESFYYRLEEYNN